MSNKATGTNCQGCPLVQGQYCSGILRPGTTKLGVIVGSPLENDDYHKRIFQEGNYKDLVVAAAGAFGVEAQEIVVINAVACASPTYLRSAKDRAAYREQAKKAIKHCEGRLKGALAQLSPDVPLIAFGPVAQKALGIKATERWEQLKSGHWAIATMDVDTASRRPAFFPVIKYAVGKALGAISTSDHRGWIKHKQIEFKLPDFTNWFFTDLGDSDLICVDIESGVEPDNPHPEATGLDWTTSDLLWVGFSKPAIPNHDPRMVGTEVMLIPGNLFDTSEGRNWLERFYTDYGKRAGGHNYKFDMNRLLRGRDIPVIQGWDTYLMAAALEWNHHKGLKDLASYWVNAPAWDDEMVYEIFEKYGVPSTQRNYADIPDDTLLQYLSYDVHYNLQLAYAMRERLKEVGRWDMPYQNYLMRVSEMITRIEQRGMVIDLDYLLEIKTKFTEQKSEAQRELEKLTRGVIKNPGSPMQVARYFYDVLKFPLCRVPGKSKRSTDVKAIEHWPDHPATAWLKQYRKADKLLGSYVNVLLKWKRRSLTTPWDGLWYVYASYNLAGAVSGRLSANDPAIQTIPYGDVRRVFVAPPGYVYAECDLSQAEVRCIGGFSQEPYLLDLYWRDGDLHTQNADEFFGPGEWGKPERTNTKTGVFATFYGAEPESAARASKLPPHLQVKVAQGFRKTYAHYLKWKEFMCEVVRDRGGMHGPFFNRWWDFSWCPPNFWHSLKKFMGNYPVQGTSSDITAYAMVQMENELLQMGAMPVLFLHDAVHIYVPKNRVHDAMEVAVTHLERSGELVFPNVPFKAESSCGTSWQDQTVDESWRHDDDKFNRWATRPTILPWTGERERYRGCGEITPNLERIKSPDRPVHSLPQTNTPH